MNKITVYFKDDCPLYQEIQETTQHFNKEPELRRRLGIADVDDGWTIKLLLGGWDRFRQEFKEAREVIIDILTDSLSYDWQQMDTPAHLADRIINEASAFGCVGKKPKEEGQVMPMA